MSLNDVCCFVPAWFGISATAFLGLLAKECSGSYAAGAAAAFIMAIVPAHLMRSVGGGYDNESIALTAMCFTFYAWTRALRNDPAVGDRRATRDSVVWGAVSGFAYIYMVAAWGGFVFVLNMVAVHATALFFLGRFTSKLHRAYSLFYVIGTLGAMRVPVVGWGPLKSTEQLAGLLVFGAMQARAARVRRRPSLSLLCSPPLPPPAHPAPSRPLPPAFPLPPPRHTATNARPTPPPRLAPLSRSSSTARSSGASTTSASSASRCCASR